MDGKLAQWFDELADRLRRVRVCCGDWSRVLTRTPTTYIGVTGVLLDQELRFITARTAGTAVTIQQEDNVAVSAGITADTGPTAVTEGTGARALVRRFFAGSEEQALAVAWNLTAAAALLNDAQVVYQRRPGSAGLVLRQNQGLAVKNLTNSTVGTVSYIIEFRDEAAT